MEDFDRDGHGTSVTFLRRTYKLKKKTLLCPFKGHTNVFCMQLTHLSLFTVTYQVKNWTTKAICSPKSIETFALALVL